MAFDGREALQCSLHFENLQCWSMPSAGTLAVLPLPKFMLPCITWVGVVVDVLQERQDGRVLDRRGVGTLPPPLTGPVCSAHHLIIPHLQHTVIRIWAVTSILFLHASCCPANSDTMHWVKGDVMEATARHWQFWRSLSAAPLNR